MTNWVPGSSNFKNRFLGAEKQWSSNRFHHLVNFLPLCFSNSLGIAPFVGQTCQKAPLFPSCRQCKRCCFVFFCLWNNKHVIRDQSGFLSNPGSWNFSFFHSKKKVSPNRWRPVWKSMSSISRILCPGLRCINLFIGDKLCHKNRRKQHLETYTRLPRSWKKTGWISKKNCKCSFPNAPWLPFFNGFRGHHWPT